MCKEFLFQGTYVRPTAWKMFSVSNGEKYVRVAKERID